MKNHFHILLFTAISIAFLSFRSFVPTPIPFQKLSGYVLNENKQPSYGNFAQLIFRDHIFSLFFSPKNPKEKLPAIDFENQTVICLIGAKSKIETTLTLDKIVKENDKYLFYFVSKKGKSLKTSIAPYCIYSMKRDKTIRGISYFLDGNLIEDVKN